MTQPASERAELWIEERHRDILRTSFRVRRTVFSAESAHQRVDVVETEGFGRMLFNDGVAMVSERDEFIYHEMIAHVPLFVHPDPRRVLVIGGGDGGTVREVLRHPGVERCCLVEIDRLVIDACREHLPSLARALDDPRVEVRIEDGVRYVAEASEPWDLVLVDSTDPVGPGAPLFGTPFYEGVRDLLSEDGIVVSQAQSPYHEPEAQRALLEVLDGVFRRVHVYNYANLTYPAGLWSFSFATNADLCPVSDLDDDRVARADIAPRYYNSAVHRAAFSLPSFQSEALVDVLTPLGSASGVSPTRR